MLLKIVQGPNAGAEIALAEGMTLSLGKGDACDILLADHALADVACEMEVEAERVRLLLPGGSEERLEPYHVKFLSEMTAIAIGPETGIWEELVWPTRATAPIATEEPAETPSTEEAQPMTATPTKRRRGLGCVIIAVILFLLLAGLALLCYWPTGTTWAESCGLPIPQVKSAVETGIQKGGEWFSKSAATPAETLPVKTLNDVATELGLTYREADVPVVSGNFSTRAQRLSATATLYATQPGIRLDISDDESLRTATTEVLDLLSEGKLKVHTATNRTLTLTGFSPSASDLRRVLEAIQADVPHVQTIDCAQVTLGDATGVVEVPDDEKAVSAVKTTRNYRDSRKNLAPKMPVVGVMTVPYPCLVLKDGSRVTEGAEFGGYFIEKIEADTIRIRGPEGSFEWRP